MNKQFISLLTLTLLISSSVVGFAQTGEDGYNPNSVRGENRMIYGQPIYENDVMYRTTIWRKINLLEKQNQPFFAIDNEISRIIIDGVRNNKLQAYYHGDGPRNDGVSAQMDTTDFFANMSYYSIAIDEYVPVKATDIYIIELREDLVFDRRRSRMYWDIQTVTLTLPAGATDDNMDFDKRIATFKYKDLDKYFRDEYEASKIADTDAATGGTTEALRAHWTNPYNRKEHMCLADALEMRLFSSRITKMANPADQTIFEIVQNEYGVADMNKILEMSRQIEYDLMEYEHNLWEY